MWERLALKALERIDPGHIGLLIALGVVSYLSFRIIWFLLKYIPKFQQTLERLVTIVEMKE